MNERELVVQALMGNLVVQLGSLFLTINRYSIYDDEFDVDDFAAEVESLQCSLKEICEIMQDVGGPSYDEIVAKVS